MSMPEPVTPPERDLGRRVQTAFDLEVTLVGFLKNLFASQRLDNPTLNLSQASAPAHPIEIVRDPDQPPVSYDYIERAQTLALKLPPRIERGRVPRTLTGEIDLGKISDVPNVIVQAIKAKVEIQEKIITKIVTVRLLFTSYDENPNSQGYQDVLNLIESAEIALCSFGQQAIDKSYPIILPIDWEIKEEYFPHFVGEMITHWRMMSGRTMPDDETFGIIPAEHIDLRASYDPKLQEALFND